MFGGREFEGRRRGPRLLGRNMPEEWRSVVFTAAWWTVVVVVIVVILVILVNGPAGSPGDAVLSSRVVVEEPQPKLGLRSRSARAWSKSR